MLAITYLDVRGVLPPVTFGAAGSAAAVGWKVGCKLQPTSSPVLLPFCRAVLRVLPFLCWGDGRPSLLLCRCSSALLLFPAPPASPATIGSSGAVLVARTAAGPLLVIRRTMAPARASTTKNSRECESPTKQAAACLDITRTQ